MLTVNDFKKSVWFRVSTKRSDPFQGFIG